MEKDKIVWKRMRFKANKVWLATDQNGKPIVKNGKVLIKYQLDQDYEYWVHEKGIKPSDPSPSETKGEGKNSSAHTLEPKAEKKGARETELPNNTDRDQIICLYTDGASSGNPGPSGIGVLLRFGTHEKEISKYIGIATNNIAELEAIRTGLLELKSTRLPVRIFTDSGYAYGVLALGWKAKKNQDIVRSIKEIISNFMDLKFIKVKGHADSEGNKRADYLATSAVETSGKK